jgi:glycerol-3-phosphate acyltransferase PlsX
VTHVAVDLLGGDGEPDAVVDGVARALAADPVLAVSLVGPLRVAEPLVRGYRGDLGIGGRLRIVEASHAVAVGEDAVRVVRSRRDVAVRVAARLIRDGVADAMVSAGPVEMSVAAATFAFGRLAGATSPALAAVLGTSPGLAVLLDAGAVTDADVSVDQLAQYAVAGSVYATICLHVVRPRVGLLSAGPAPPDRLPEFTGVMSAGELITELGLDWVGAVDAAAVVTGGTADVVVSGGFTGAVLLSCLRSVAPVAGQVLPGSSGWYPQEGAFVVGVDGIVVVVGGRSGKTAAGVAHAIAEAAAADRAGWVPRQRAALATLVACRRIRAGLSA